MAAMTRWGVRLRGVLMALSLPFVCGDLPASSPSSEDQLAAQAEFVEALAGHFKSLEPLEGIETRFAELRAGLDLIRTGTGRGKLEPEKLVALEREIRLHSDRTEDYREEYVRWVRLAARGERHPELRTRYGLEIRHSSGTARLRHGDLTGEWQERFLWDEKEARRSLAEEARTDREMELLQRYAVEQGVDPVVAREQETARLVLAKLESSAPIVPAKLEPSEPLELAELELAELEPATNVGATRSKGSKKSR